MNIAGAEADNHELSHDEQQILKLWDTLEQLQLGIAALKAERDYLPPDEDPTDQDLQQAVHENMEAKVLYGVHRAVLDAVLVANPTLQAIHAGSGANPIEQNLLPQLEKQDKSAFDLAHRVHKLEDCLDEDSRIGRQLQSITQENALSARKMLRLVGEIEAATKAKMDVTPVPNEVKRLESEVAEARKRWTVLKSTASAIIAGSGVDWVDDEELCDVVLDPADE